MHCDEFSEKNCPRWQTNRAIIIIKVALGYPVFMCAVLLCFLEYHTVSKNAILPAHIGKAK